MTIAIVDDIAEERSLLHARLEEQLHRHKIDFQIFEYEDGESFLAASRNQNFTVLFLDIYMNGANGIEIAREFRHSDKDCLLIFTTTSKDFALEGFQVRAMHYLVKPYTKEDLSALTDEILARIPAPDKSLTVKINGNELQIPFKSIVHADHFSHMIHIHTAIGKELVTRQSFRAFTEQLNKDSRFFICNRGTVINMEHAVDFDGTIFLLDDECKVSVSRELIKSAQQSFMDFLFQRGNF
nr:LytTR family DNA-binding domain-containing protein [uncultured Mediterraneibacter sp.]